MTKVQELEAQLEAHLKTLQGYKENGGFTGDTIAKIQEAIHAIDEQVCSFH
jgi:hypothetical protein